MKFYLHTALAEYQTVYKNVNWNENIVSIGGGTLGYFATTFTAPLGTMAAHRIKVGLLRKLFAVLLLVLATKLLLKVL